MSTFEGSYLGNADRIDPATRMECGVCWWVYDPALGDPEWQIAQATPFAALPDHWRCPRCDAAPHQFMALAAGGAGRDGADDFEVRQDASRAALCRAYEQVAARMKDLPVYNAALDVAVVGRRDSEEGLVCVVITPWMMNLALLPGSDARKRREGTTRNVQFPSGAYGFTAAYLDDFGALETCSLFSPMDCFDDMAVARQVAREALGALFAPGRTEKREVPQEVPDNKGAFTRRDLFRGAAPSGSGT